MDATRIGLVTIIHKRDDKVLHMFAFIFFQKDNYYTSNLHLIFSCDSHEDVTRGIRTKEDTLLVSYRIRVEVKKSLTRMKTGKTMGQ